ncbi:MAG TPA: type ISP restriction/modification enzyme, partial [Chitinophagaceae bacterium]|nr:type ISP restriction/modification enzyme [Chitinophagaceae bacterium]
QQLAKLGEELAELHLLKHKSLNHPTTKYFGKGNSDKIEKPMYDEEAKRVFINESRYFDNISPEVWNYQVGGYQPMEKYLKDRAKAGRQMDDPGHYCKMATALAKTIEVQKEIDKLFPEAESEVLSFI